MGDWVLSKPENGNGEPEYRPVTGIRTYEAETMHYYQYGSEDAPQHYMLSPEQEVWQEDFGWLPLILATAEKHTDFMSLQQSPLRLIKNRALEMISRPGAARFFVDPKSRYGTHFLVDCSTIAITEDTEELVSGFSIQYVPPEPFQGSIYSLEIEEYHTCFIGALGLWVRCPSRARS